MKTIIIAEAGVNHNGDFNQAKELVKVAAEAGADYVKFQTFKADKIVSKDALKAAYQRENLNDGDDNQYIMLKKLEMPEIWHFELMAYADELDIKFLSTGFDEGSINFLETLNLELYKIPSGEITNKPLLQHIASKGKSVVLSTGMANIEEIKQAVTVIEQTGLSRDLITVLHCNTEYPTPMKDVNLFAMQHIKQEIGVAVGYSDHTLGIEVPIAAVALGAKVIEKHFTLDRNLPGPDHRASLEPHELREMVKSIRNIELAISGSGIKVPSSSEIENLNVVRKSIHCGRSILKGEIISQEALICLRPGTGISPMDWDNVIGRKAKENLDAYHILNYSDLE